MKIETNEILTNGFRDDINEDNRIIDFILGALDNGFQVKMPGIIQAKFGRLEVFTHRQGENKTVYIYNDKMQLAKYPLQEFHWHDVEMFRGKMYYNKKFIGRTSLMPQLQRKYKQPLDLSE